ncbi:hypothetical protein QPK24_11185 [Paenibacillus polygoni]|uniref:Sublancin immunity protein SunI-like PH domain-containing protein n=1 Tax=Paenibacillus polygoni TaxID=3050112 RepID=A0ABY8XCQ4_9BACL|nr:hypothetical protein [Paenibacillus polygoni]WIV21190.1 hypothetical protein QPK24_11185 [Paenibacillus polygoni]
MLGVKVEKINDDLIIKWQLSKIEIPKSEIVNISHDDTYGGEQKDAIRIGTPYGTTDRIIIKTNSQTYILFTTNVTSLHKKISTIINL